MVSLDRVITYPVPTRKTAQKAGSLKNNLDRTWIAGGSHQDRIWIAHNSHVVLQLLGHTWREAPTTLPNLGPEFVLSGLATQLRGCGEVSGLATQLRGSGLGWEDTPCNLSIRHAYEEVIEVRGPAKRTPRAKSNARTSVKF